MEAGIDCGGWCPAGRRAEDGVIAEHYPLTETRSAGYTSRTRKNVADSDGTLILVLDPVLNGGTALTERAARRHNKPVLVITLSDDDFSQLVAQTVNWVRSEDTGTLNVAGPRESGSPGIYHLARSFMRDLVASLTR